MNPDLNRQARVRWPFDGDTPLQRARRLALAYRQHLRTANPEMCDALDDAARAYGETWVCEQPVTVSPDQMLTTPEAAELAGVGQETIHKWRRRGILSADGGRRYLETRGLSERGWPMFKAAQVLEFAAETRRRRLHVAVS